jgi:hypothetical protein
MCVFRIDWLISFIACKNVQRYCNVCLLMLCFDPKFTSVHGSTEYSFGFKRLRLYLYFTFHVGEAALICFTRSVQDFDTNELIMLLYQ